MLLSYPRVPLIAALLICGCFVAVAAALAGDPITLAEPSAVIVLNGDEPQQERQEPHPTWQARKPATQPIADAKLQALFNDLAASDAAARDAALGELLALTRAELPGLRRVVEQSRPVAPSQAHALRDVVNHVFLSGETYNAEPRVGFLGLGMPTLDSVEVPRVGERPDPPNAPGLARANTGVPVEHRIPGFCAFRTLRDGDVILAIMKPTPRRLRDWNELTYAVRTFRAGETITLQVLRQGTILSVPVTLDATVLVPHPDVWHQVLLPKREAAAEAQWNEHFAPLMEQQVLTTTADGATFYRQ